MLFQWSDDRKCAESLAAFKVPVAVTWTDPLTENESEWLNNDLIMIWMKLRMALLSAKIAKGTGGRHRVRRRCLSLILNHIHLHKGTYNLLLCARGWNVRCIFGGMKAFQWLALARCWSMRRLEIAGHWPLALAALATPWKSRCQWPLPRCHCPWILKPCRPCPEDQSQVAWVGPGAYEDSQALCHQGSSSLVLRIAATSNSTLFYSESLDTGHLCFFIVLHCFNFFAAGGTW